MKKTMAVAAIAAIGALTSACTTTGGVRPVDVTRYHLGSQIDRQSFTVEPLKTTSTISPEYQSYADAVARELEGQGFTRSANTADAAYVAAVSFTRAPMGVVQKPSPFRIGLGGGSFGGNVGVGAGGSVGIGGGTREVIGTELSVQLRRRTDSTVIWEGRAVTQTILGDDRAQPSMVSQKLAAALFKGFPGESGITITVK